jgi:hypothetical protein
VVVGDCQSINVGGLIGRSTLGQVRVQANRAGMNGKVLITFTGLSKHKASESRPVNMSRPMHKQLRHLRQLV